MKYKVVNTEALTARKRPSLSGEVFSYLKKGQVVNVVKGKIKEKDGIKWRQIKIKGQKAWVSAKYLKRVEVNYRKKVLEKAALVYKTVIEVGAKHEGGAKSLAQIKSKKKTTCATSVSASLQEAGMMAKGKLISHTNAVGSSKAVRKKRSRGKAMSGFDNLKKGTFTIHWVGKSWNKVPAKYKIPGAVYIYDSNIAIYKGDGVFYTTNNGGSQKKNGKYVKDQAKSGYCFTSPVLYTIIPKA